MAFLWQPTFPDAGGGQPHNGNVTRPLGTCYINEVRPLLKSNVRFRGGGGVDKYSAVLLGVGGWMGITSWHPWPTLGQPLIESARSGFKDLAFTINRRQGSTASWS